MTKEKARFMVIAQVEGKRYATKVEAYSNGGAEHVVLDLSWQCCGKYTVEYAQAYDTEAMKTENFVSNMMNSTLIEFEDLKDVIAEANERMNRYENLVRNIRDAKKIIEDMNRELKEMEKEFENLKEYFEGK